MSATWTGTTDGAARAAGRDRVSRTVRNLTVGTGIGALVATGALVTAAVPHPTAAVTSVFQDLQQQPDDDRGSFTGGSGSVSSSNRAPVVSSGAS